MRSRAALLFAVCATAACEAAERPLPEDRAVLVLESDVEEADEEGLARALVERARATEGIESAALETVGGGRFELAVFAAAPEALERLAAGLEHRGGFALAIVAEPEDGVDLDGERRRLAAWLAEHPDAPIGDFAAHAPDEGGPHPRIRWAERDPEDPRFADRPRAERCVPLLVQPDPAWRFATADLARAYRTRVPDGSPAIGFELAGARKQAFSDFTAAHVHRILAVEIGGSVRTAASISSRLPGEGIATVVPDPELADAVCAALSTGVALPADVRVVDVRR